MNRRTALVQRPRRNGCSGCLYAFLVAVVIALIVIVAGWVFYLRPTIHDIAQNKLDSAMSAAVRQLPSVPEQLPVSSFQIQDSMLNNLIVLNLSPADPVQHPQTTITPSNIRIDFLLYGFPCAIVEAPTVQNGQLIATNVKVEGVVGLIMSPEEITTLSNKHLSEAQNRIKHTLKGVDLKNHEMDLIFN